MINIYTGTPGSGKSLHAARDIFLSLKKYKYRQVVSNIPIKMELFTDEEKERFIYIETNNIKVSDLWDIGEKWYKSHEELKLNRLEQSSILIIDECQLLFNAREWGKNTKKGWPEFFSLHRHVGYKIILVTQMIEAVDKQVRGLIEFEDNHQKVKSMGATGAFINMLALGGLFRVQTYWTPKKERIDTSFFKYKRLYGELYDTHELFKKPDFKENNNNHKHNMRIIC